MEHITAILPSRTSLIWNELGTFYTHEATDKSLMAALETSEEIVNKIANCFDKNDVRSFLFVFNYLHTIYRDIFPVANQRLEPEVKSIIDSMLINKEVINAQTLTERFRHTIIPTSEEKGLLMKDAVMKYFPMNNGAMQTTLTFKPRPKSFSSEVLIIPNNQSVVPEPHL